MHVHPHTHPWPLRNQRTKPQGHALGRIMGNAAAPEVFSALHAACNESQNARLPWHQTFAGVLRSVQHDGRGFSKAAKWLRSTSAIDVNPVVLKSRKCHSSLFSTVILLSSQQQQLRAYSGLTSSVLLIAQPSFLEHGSHLPLPLLFKRS